ncbi:hypothetical protein NUW54_g7903 [Trametes sanguinea]|uniref:Uncharacterized protein n=1 Tax=Trametes sanguinea TaxID=158606 RepID=A0ACC1PJ28_9APHY|nr:hypothetical protein NUW54_g7903 [Trametes sanguinea]
MWHLPSALAKMSAKPTMRTSALSASDVFPRDNHTGDDLRRQIANILTIASAKLKKGEPYSAKVLFKHLSSDTRAKSAILGHVSTVLTVGHPPTDNVVTGRLDPDGVTLLCTTHQKSEPGQAQAAIRSVPIDPAEGKRLLDQWWAIPDPPEKDFFATHVSQVGSILAYAWGLDVSQRLGGDPSVGDVSHRFIQFMVHRARSTIVARIHHAKILWGDWPLKIMRTWFENHLNNVVSGTVEFSRIGPFLADTLARHDLRPEPDRPNFCTFSASTVLSWIDVLQALLDDILEAFGDTTVASTKDQTFRAYSAIAQLDSLLRSTLLNALDPHAVNNSLGQVYFECCEYEQFVLPGDGPGREESLEGRRAPKRDDSDYAASLSVAAAEIVRGRTSVPVPRNDRLLVQSAAGSDAKQGYGPEARRLQARK